MTRKIIPCKELKFCECGCGEQIPIHDSRGRSKRFKNYHYARVQPVREFTPEWRHKLSLAHTGRRHWNWKGGRGKHSGGYMRVWTRNGRILEHRYVWEKYYKACLLEWADVHHINHNKTDNRVENLLAIMNWQHPTLHKKYKKCKGGCGTLLQDSDKDDICFYCYMDS